MSNPVRMSDSDVDSVYTALAEALGRVGAAKTPLLLSTLALALLADLPSQDAALQAIAQAEQLTD